MSVRTNEDDDDVQTGSRAAPSKAKRVLTDNTLSDNGRNDNPDVVAWDMREIVKDLISSVAGSSACVYTGQPFDTVKVRLQVGASGQYTGAFDCAKQVVQMEGALKLFSGSVPALTGAVLENATAFALNGMLKRMLGDRDNVPYEDKPFYEPFATGAVTGFTTAFVLCPCDIVKCRAQVAQELGHNHSVKQIIGAIYKQRGLLGFYSGMNAQITRDIFFYASFFGP
jgi:hypothetical protein